MATTSPRNDNVGTLRLSRSFLQAESDLLLWIVIRNSAKQLGFQEYKNAIDSFLCGDMKDLPNALRGFGTTEDVQKALLQPAIALLTNMDAYHLLKAATEAYVAVTCAVELPHDNDQRDFKVDAEEVVAASKSIDAAPPTARQNAQLWEGYLERINGSSDWTLPYLTLVRDKLSDAPLIQDTLTKLIKNDTSECYGILRDKLTKPIFLELIWSYWHEEGMLVQTMNAISRRFQNMRGLADQDPLAILDIDPLRPINNLLWGYVQDEQFRLTVVRRAYEYNHHYGLTLEGKAVPPLRPADSRSRFLESFHNLLHLASIYFRQDDDTTVRADGFPVLNALKDLHMLLAEGAHNQYGDLPTRARIEMLMQQWLLARPEFREFLPTRVMVAYPEPWMDRVDAMKKLQGWGEISVIQFRELAVFGEQLLLSVRFGNWSQVANAAQAAVWARYWRSEISGYIHAYRAVTGVDLSADSIWEQQRALVTTQPSALLNQRLLGGQLPPMLPAGGTAISVQSFRARQMARKRLLPD